MRAVVHNLNRDIDIAVPLRFVAGIGVIVDVPVNMDLLFVLR
jgi:hypothetical protein